MVFGKTIFENLFLGKLFLGRDELLGETRFAIKIINEASKVAVNLTIKINYKEVFLK